MSIKKEHKSKMLGILNVLFPGAQIYLFGSRARGTYTDSSDVDIAIDAGQKMELSSVGEARDVMEALYIPYKVDVVDVYRMPEDMRKMVLSEGKLWRQ
ncbi:MAG: nucleotidyltransferase domain-containing protein [Candidatus Dependentiae bacterium]